jgi:hypothetical protein
VAPTTPGSNPFAPAGRVLVAFLVLLATSSIRPTSSTASAAATSCYGIPAGVPCLTATPSAGPVGTRILLSGSVAGYDRQWRRLLNTDFIGLIRDVGPSPHYPIGCEILAGAGHPVLRVTRSGRVIDTAPLVVTRRGSCNQTDLHHQVTPGTYHIFVGCFTCDVAVFRVTRSSPPPTLAGTGGSIALASAAGLVLLGFGIYLSRRFRRAA